MNSLLHIIVNCTDRKRAPIPDELRLRSISARDIEDRASKWWRRIERYRGGSVSAEDLYAGGHWAVARRLPGLAAKAGYKATLWVSSAGYGLVPSTTCLYPYSATFAPSQPDAVVASTAYGQSRKDLLQSWWDALSRFANGEPDKPRSLTDLALRSPGSRFLIVASPDYLLAMERDLLTAIPHLADPNRLVIVSSRPRVESGPLSAHLVPSDARLLPRVGGTRVSLHARIALMLLENVESWGFGAEALRKRIEARIARSPGLPKYERERMTDDQVRNFIRRALAGSPQPSCSSLLRTFREGGHACEQSRFKKLYWKVKGGRHEV